VPHKTLSFVTLHFPFFGIQPDVSHLCIFVCKFHPNQSATNAHKLAPRSTVCVFLGYPLKHKGYHFLNLATNRIIIYHHVTFDESSFSFAEISVLPSSHFDFLSDFDCAPLPIGPCSVTGITTPLSGRPGCFYPCSFHTTDCCQQRQSLDALGCYPCRFHWCCCPC
jgi:hypothetical protein